MSAFEIEIGQDEAGTRLDVLLARSVPDLGRARAKTLIEEGAVRVDGRLVSKSYPVVPGDRVTLERLPDPVDFSAAPDPAFPLRVLFECDAYVVVDKPARTPSHPLRPGELGTVAGALVARYPEMRRVGYRMREPGILHRLDFGTSGAMLAARTREAFDRLREELRAGRLEKRYLARCSGEVPAPLRIETPIAHDPSNPRRVRTCVDRREVKRLGARPASTEVLRTTPSSHGSLIEIRANRGLRHQIRVHLASVGHPLLGDVLYGGPPMRDVDHHLLHASSIRIGTRLVRAEDWGYADRALEIATIVR